VRGVNAWSLANFVHIPSCQAFTITPLYALCRSRRLRWQVRWPKVESLNRFTLPVEIHVRFTLKAPLLLRDGEMT
jgi:hypothetical protein